MSLEDSVASGLDSEELVVPSHGAMPLDTSDVSAPLPVSNNVGDHKRQEARKITS